MENDQPSTDQSLTAPQLPTAPEDSETKNKKKCVAPVEDQESVVGLNSTSSNNQARIYECVFCKRGFANAQALGGHMNIHRKDKEKLKHQYPGRSSIDQTARLMDMVIPRMIQHRPQALPPPPVVSWGNWMIQEEGKKAEVKGRGDNNWLSTNSEEVKKLPLFADRPLNKRDREEQRLVVDHQDEIPMIRGREDVDKGKSSSEGHGSSDVLVVDLELRLGPEPPDPSLQPSSARKFL